LHAYYAIKEPV